MEDAVLIVVEMAGQIVQQVDAVVIPWERCSALALEMNAKANASVEAFCRTADALSLFGGNLVIER